MLALDVYLNILLGYELLFVFLMKSKQSAITTHGDGLSRQTLRFETRFLKGNRHPVMRACAGCLYLS